MISGTRYQLRLEMNRQLGLATDIARGQAEISSGKRVLAPSDDPAAAARISDIARVQANETTWRTNLDRAYALSQSADDVLATVVTRYDRANELMLSASNATLSDENRRSVALELTSIAQEIATLRDTRDSRAELLFASGEALGIPVGRDLVINAVSTRGAVFDSVAAPGGTTDLVGIIASAAAAVASNNPTAIAASLAAVTAGSDHAVAARGEQGARGGRIDAIVERLENSKIGLAEERSSLESANIIEVVAQLQAKQLSLEAAQAAFARINRSNLFDLIR